jgi:hypothetical protein
MSPNTEYIYSPVRTRDIKRSAGGGQWILAMEREGISLRTDTPNLGVYFLRSGLGKLHFFKLVLSIMRDDCQFYFFTHLCIAKYTVQQMAHVHMCVRKRKDGRQEGQERKMS